MAASFDKALNRAPRGLMATSALTPVSRGRSIGSNPDDEPQEDDENSNNIVVLVRGDEDESDEDLSAAQVEDLEEDEFNENLAEAIISEANLMTLASDLISDFDDDINSRKEWVNTYVDGLELLGLK